jgi:hypothetical protein
MKVTMLLADSAQAVNGKLYILGGGWSIIGPDPAATAIAIKIDVPWDLANRSHTFRLALLDADEQPVVVPTPIGDHALELTGQFEAGRPAGLKPGTDLDVVLAINVGAFPIKADSRYLWRIFINNQTKPDWQVVFTTRPSKPAR